MFFLNLFLLYFISSPNSLIPDTTRAIEQAKAREQQEGAHSINENARCCMKNRVLLLISIVLSSFVICGMSYNPGATTQKEKTGPLKKAPDFALLDLDGNPFRLSDFSGKVIILNFWTTWCPFCRMDIEHFKSLYEQYREQGLEIVGIALDQGGAPAVRPFVQDNKINYTVLIGNQEVVDAYGGIQGLPTTFIIDRQGNIIEKMIGYREKEAFESIIEQLL
jgi:cytochrome c biogenesis protein CcmG/thiol:disulfide interchange protein DsbE